MLNGALWVCWQGAADGMVVLFTRPRTNAGLEPLFVCIFFRVLLANPARVREFQRGIRDCCGRGPMGRVFKRIQNHTGMKSLLWKSMTNGKSHQTLCLPHNWFRFPLRESQGYVVGIQIRTTACCLSKANQRSLPT